MTLPTDEDGYIVDDGFDDDIQSVRDHYDQVRPVLAELAELGDEYPTVGLAGNSGWYVYIDTSDKEQIEQGWEKRRRPTLLSRDLSELLGDIRADGRDREVFNITTWKDPDAASTWQYARSSDDESGYEGKDGSNPLPEYADTRGMGLWVDLDLADKTSRASLTGDDLETVEAAQSAILSAVADLYGVEDSEVYALDSGGGAYVYGPPEATLPIIDHLADDTEARELFLDDVADRFNDYGDGTLDGVEGIWPQVCSEVKGAAELLDPDWMQNKNRQSKAPGSLHHSHDIVVTPLRDRGEDGTPTAGPDYTPRLVSEFAEADADSLKRWAAGLTSIEHRNAVGDVVKALYPDLADRTDDWRETVDARVKVLREKKQKREERAEKVREHYEELTDGDTERTATGLKNADAVVADRSKVAAAIDRIDVGGVLKEHASDDWDTSTRDHEVTFDPSWRTSGSGKSCAVPNGENTFVDNKYDRGGGPVTAYAIGEVSGVQSPKSDVDGETFGRALDQMRADGYNIPVYVPDVEDTEEYNQTPLWALRRAAVAFDICDADEFTERETEEGDTYLGFPDRTRYNATLTALEQEGIAHGREPVEGNPATETPDAFTDDDADATNTEDSDVPDAAVTKPTEPAGNLVERNGCYGYSVIKQTEDGEEHRWYEATNFLLETEEFIETDDGTQMRLRVHPAHVAEDPYEVVVEPTVFNEPREFKSEIVTGRTTQFDNQRSSTLNELRETVGAQRGPTREAIDYIGAAGPALEKFVTPEGVLSSDGWDDEPEELYLPKTADGVDDDSIVGAKWNLESDEYDADEVRMALRELPEARLPARGLATLGWFYAAPTKPLVDDREGEFNHLNVRGKTESGKTSYLELLTEAFGMEGEPWEASATRFSLEQLHVGSRGPPVWIDEYKPSDMRESKVDRLHQLMRKATREATRNKGRPDQTHISFTLRSPIVLSGEQSVSEPAVRRRSVQVNLSTRARDRQDSLAAYSRLAGSSYETADGDREFPDGVDLRHHARAYYRFLAERDSETLGDVWDTAEKRATRLLDDEDISLDGSELQGAQTVVFGYQLYRRFASEMGVETESLPDEGDLQAALLHIAENVGQDGQRREHGDEFLELVSQAANAGYVMNGSEAAERDGAPAYRVFDPSSTPEEGLALHLPTVYPAVKRYVRDYNLDGETTLLGKNDYVDEFSDLAESPAPHVEAVSHRTRIDCTRKRCLLLDPYAVVERLGGTFDLAAFGLDALEQAEDSNDADRGDDDGDDSGSRHDVDTTPLAAVADDPTGYPNVQVEIAETETLENDSAPALTGTVLDTAGDAMDLVVWDDADALTAREGDEVVLENVATTDYNGQVQLVIKPTVTDVTVLTATVSGDTDDDQADLTEAAGETETPDGNADDSDGGGPSTDQTEDTGTATADGGTLDDIQNVTPRVVSAVRQLDNTVDYPDGVPPEDIKAEVDATEAEVEHGIEKACQDGALFQPSGGTGKYRTT